MAGDWRSYTTNSDAKFFVIEGDPAGADRSEMASESSRVYERPADKKFTRLFAKNTLKHLPSQTPALLALTKTFVRRGP